MKSESVTFVFGGDIPAKSFARFAQHRARRLDVVLKISASTDEGAEMTVTGQKDLIDAFEMAMSLGPQDCLVRDVMRQPGALTGKGEAE